MGSKKDFKDNPGYVPDTENPLVSEEDENWGRPMYLSPESRHLLCQSLEDGTASPEVLKYAASLIRDPEYKPSNMMFHFSKWWREIDDITILLERGFTTKAYLEIAKHLREGQVDFQFLKFAADILEDVASIEKLPKRPRKEKSSLTFKVGEAFEQAEHLGIKGERRKQLLASKFKMPFTTLDAIWQDYRRFMEEMSLEESRLRQEEIDASRS